MNSLFDGLCDLTKHVSSQLVTGFTCHVATMENFGTILGYYWRQEVQGSGYKTIFVVIYLQLLFILFVVIRAMVNAAQSGKKSGCNTPTRISFGNTDSAVNPESLHKKVLNRLTHVARASPSLMESPMNRMTSLKLTDTPKPTNTPQQAIVSSGIYIVTFSSFMY